MISLVGPVVDGEGISPQRDDNNWRKRLNASIALLVEDKVLVELKSVQAMLPIHRARIGCFPSVLLCGELG